ncbi:MAG: hypothetical protein OSB62_04825 [Alphaproteobacteria bacterium]|nr:hypothetical protein [Alphaproteobacteria bacterium]
MALKQILMASFLGASVLALSACQKSVPTGKIKAIAPYTFHVTEFTDGREEHATMLSSLKYGDAYPFKPVRISEFLTEVMNVDLFAYEAAHLDMHLVDYASIKGPKDYTLSYVLDVVVRRAKTGEVMVKDSYICREDGRGGFQAAETLSEVSEGKRPTGQDEKIWNRLEKQCMMGVANKLAIGVLAWHNTKLAEK